MLVKMYLFQLGHANRELHRHGCCKKRAIIPSYSSFLQIAVNADIPEGTHATLPNGITTLTELLPESNSHRYPAQEKKNSCEVYSCVI